MFITGNHAILYSAAGLYLLSGIFILLKKNRPANFILLGGIILNLLYLMGRGWLSGIFIAQPIFEGPFLLPCIMAIILLIIGAGKRGNGILIVPVVLFSVFAMWYAKGMIPPTPKKITVWAYAFLITESTAHALYYTGAMMALISIIKKKTEDDYKKYIVWGFVVFSISQVVGAVWSYLGWGNSFGWNPRHLTTAALWIMYAAYIHLRFLPEWNAAKRHFFALIAGIVLLCFTYGHYLHEMTFSRIGG